MVLECVIVASPQAEVSWYHDNNLIKQAENIKMYSEEDRHRLSLKELEVCQAGKYKVVARNRLGESSSSCQLDVKHAKTSSSSQTSSSPKSLVGTDSSDRTPREGLDGDVSDGEPDKNIYNDEANCSH